jgi:Protein phosphatase 2C
MTTPGNSTVTWNLIADSVRGAAHVRTGLPNQDAFKLMPGGRSGKSAIVALSDGHGSSECFRSDIGSRFAVDAAVGALSPLLEPPERISYSTLKHLVEQQLPRDILRDWKARVSQHLKENPVTRPQEDGVENGTFNSNEANPYLAYGATLIAVLVTDLYLVYLQLGDGDIVAVSEEGQALRPIPRDDRLIANMTTSLCMEDADREMRVKFQMANSLLPAMILVSTDGYSNSFVDDESFLKAGPDMLRAILDNGLDSVSKVLSTWLSEASQLGSGDDTTVAVLLRSGPGTSGGMVSPGSEESV